MKKQVNIALFASGSGSNVENIHNYFREKSDINISCVLCNNKDAYVLTRASLLNLDFLLFNRSEFNESDKILHFLDSKNIDLIVLAGFLWLIPDYLIKKYSNRIINIHPALLPKYGGRGMYGDRVHIAVYENRELESGITIHYVNGEYDEGEIIAQYRVGIDPNEGPDSIADKVHGLEYKYYPIEIEKLAVNLQHEH